MVGDLRNYSEPSQLVALIRRFCAVDQPLPVDRLFVRDRTSRLVEEVAHRVAAPRLHTAHRTSASADLAFGRCPTANLHGVRRTRLHAGFPDVRPTPCASFG